MKTICNIALNELNKNKITYGDIRIINSQIEQIIVKNGKIGSLINEETLGYGIRVLKNGAWGFASNNDINKKTIKETANLAILIAEASALTKKKDIKLTNEPAITDLWITPIIIDPFKIPVENKLSIMYEVDRITRKNKKIKESKVFMYFKKENKIFASTEGSFIQQIIYISGGGFSVIASSDNEIQIRSYPFSFEGLHRTMGYEIINSIDLIGNAERIREEAIALLKAKECPANLQKDIILMPSQLVLQIHESAGHASELDRVLGYEADFAGTSFLTPEKLNKFRYGSSIVNLVADSTLPTGLATQGYDDDGVKSQKWYIVKNGIFNGYMVNRETAYEIGLDRSLGCNRAESYSNIPITRITNLSLMPDKGTLEDLIADTKDGILMDTNKSWSIDQKRLNFQFGCEIAWEIKNGKKKEILKNPYYHGITPEFWNACDYICGPEEWQLLGVMNCGKGQPMQTNYMSHGSSPSRFRKINLGT